MSVSKVLFAAALLLLVPVSSTAEVCSGQCDNGNSYAVQDVGGYTRIVTFQYEGEEASGLEVYRTNESAGSACRRLSIAYC
jgi:hypothetical protein